MPAVRRATAPLLIVVGLVFAGGIGFGAVAALTTPRKPDEAKATSPDPTPATEPAAPATEPAAPPPTTAKAEPTKRAEPKPEPKKNPPPKSEKKPDPPKTEPTKKVEPPKPEPISYEKQIFPIFKAKCLMCHGDPQRKADVDLRTLASAVKGGSSGDGAVPGKPEKSSLWLAIEDNSMPPPGREKMSAAEKKLVKDWILSGAK
jgi:hypothetical protein